MAPTALLEPVRTTLAGLGYTPERVEATDTDVVVTLPGAGMATLELRDEGFDVAIAGPTTLLVHGRAA